jgi:hypothetical protein
MPDPEDSMIINSTEAITPPEDLPERGGYVSICYQCSKSIP